MAGGALVFDRAVVSQVQQANDIIDLVSEHVSLSKKGKEMVGLCPFHEDHKPSMYVSGVKQIFKCFACGAGGDVFKFVQLRENLTFPQAVERLAERVGIKLKSVSSARRQTQSHPDVDPNRLAKANAWAAKYFHENLGDKEKGKSTRDYIDERGITQASVTKWQIGLAVTQNDMVKKAKERKIPDKLLEQAGLVVGNRGGSGFGDKFVNRLMFPITDVTGRVLGFGGRTLDGNNAKYINSPTTPLFDKSNSLYGLEHARHKMVSADMAIVVEGYTDVIAVHQSGCENVVATLGTSFTSGHARILRRYTKNVVLVFDSDTAGIAAANRALEVCLSQHIDIKLALLPEGKDPCDFILEAGKEQFEQIVDRAVDVFQFKWNRLSESFKGDQTLASKKAVVEEFLQTIAIGLSTGNLEAIEKGLIVNRLSKVIGLDSREINAELNKRISRSTRAAGYAVENQKVQSLDLGQGLFATAQREILEVLLNEPKLFESVAGRVEANTFDVPVLKQIATTLFEMLGKDVDLSLAEILAHTESIDISGCIVELANAGERKGNFKSRLLGALDTIKRCQQQVKNSEIKIVENQVEFLQKVYKSTGKQNPHNVGMV